MKIMITGISGMVASHLADLCIEKGDEIWGTYRWQEDNSNIKHLLNNPLFHRISMNLNDSFNVLKVIDEVKPDCISHLAAESYVTDSFSFPHEAISVNGLGTLNLLEAVRIVKEKDNNFRYPFDPVIHICSSSEVYGLVNKEDIPIKETQEFNPANPYACGKVLADVLTKMYHNNYGLKTITTRMFTHTSFRRKMKSAEVNFAEQIIKFEMHHIAKGYQSVDDKYIIKHGNLDSIRTWADARDAVKAYYLILTQPKKFGEVYNIGGNTTKTIGEMLDYMISLSLIREFLYKEQDPKLMRKYDVTLQIPDCSKFKQDYPDWKPEISFEQSISDLLEEKRKHEH